MLGIIAGCVGSIRPRKTSTLGVPDWHSGQAFDCEKPVLTTNRGSRMRKMELL
jgi:hypothetical protein